MLDGFPLELETIRAERHALLVFRIFANVNQGDQFSWLATVTFDPGRPGASATTATRVAQAEATLDVRLTTFQAGGSFGDFHNWSEKVEIIT